MESQDPGTLLECPECKQQSLKFDTGSKLYECTDEECELTFTREDSEEKGDDRPILEKILLFPVEFIWALIKSIFKGFTDFGAS